MVFKTPPKLSRPNFGSTVLITRKDDPYGDK